MLREPVCEVHQRDRLERLCRQILDDPRWLPFLERLGMPPIQWDAIEFEVNLPDQGLNMLPKSTTRL